MAAQFFAMDCNSACVFLVLCLASRIHARCENGAVRLSGGPNQFEGRVDFCVNGSWGQVCSMGWTTNDAKVVCHQLGHTRVNAIRTLGDVYGGASLSTAVTNVRCNGNESRLGDCLLDLTTVGASGTCNTTAGAICQDPECLDNPSNVRLSDGQIVEICASGYRTAVCSNNWDNADATVVCRQLGQGEIGVANSTVSVVYQSRLPYDNVNCTGNEESLSACRHGLVGSVRECSTGRIARVHCEDATPPVDPSTSKSSTTTAGAGAETTTFTAPVETSTADADSTVELKTIPTSRTIVNTQETIDPDSGLLNQSEPLLAIVLGVVLGLIALLLFGIIMLLILIVLGRKRRKYTVQYLDGRPNGDPMMATMEVKAIDGNQLVNSYISQKVDHERHLLNPLYLQKREQMANNNPLPYASVVTPPSITGEDSQLHEYATLDNFQPTASQWPLQQPQEYSIPTPSPKGEVVRYTSSSGEASTAYSESVVRDGSYVVGEDGIVTDLQGYASLDPTAHHSYDYPHINGAASAFGAEVASTLSVPQPYETPLESSYEDASSNNLSRSSTPLSVRRGSPERGEGEEKASPYAEPTSIPDADKSGSSSNTASFPTHDYATLEPPK